MLPLDIRSLYLSMVLVLVTNRQYASTQAAAIFEVCNRHVFNASCADDEVIMMRLANYGRMRLGRCVRANLGYLGCGANVLTHVDQRCSGRQHCTFTVPDDTMYATQPCPGDTTSYLEASYDCIKVATPSDKPCHSNRPVTIGYGEDTQVASPQDNVKGAPPRDIHGYISSEIADKEGAGSLNCPWVIRALPGQRLNLTLHNFLQHVTSQSGADDSAVGFPPSGGSAAPSSSHLCYEIALLVDGESKQNVLSCGKTGTKNVFVSRGSQVKVIITRRNTESIKGAFLLEYGVFGCPNIRAPSGAVVTVTGDNAVVKCNLTKETWYLTCKGSTWAGHIGNCSSAGPSDSSWAYQTIFHNESTFPYGILIAVALGVALGVFLGGVLLTIVVVHTKRKRRARRNETGTLCRTDATSGGIYSGSTSKYVHNWASSPDAKLLEGDPACQVGTAAIPGSYHPDASGCPKHGHTPLPGRDHQLSEQYRGGGNPATLGRSKHFYESPKFV